MKILTHFLIGKIYKNFRKKEGEPEYLKPSYLLGK